MAVNPGIGDRGGQHYDIVRAIQTFLGQMAEGGIGLAAAVIKELLQNADDAAASEVSVLLDERIPPAILPEEYRPLLGPAILVRNNAPFRLPKDVRENESDDFTAIRDVASGHKRAQATAAGRFGIGFNSVYFLTDTPVLFSRREVHVFDLLHRVFEDNGWRFPLDDFPKASGSLTGPAKSVVQWLFPRASLGAQSFEALANSPEGDFGEAVVRLPLRDTADGLPSLHPDRFRDATERERILHEMAEEAAKSVLFLKNVRLVTVGKLTTAGVEQLHSVTVAEPCVEFRKFLSDVSSITESGAAKRLECQFERKVVWQDERRKTPIEWNYWVKHVADFADEGMRRLRERLKINGERAIPWGAIAVPLDAESVRHDGEIPDWRVFLPLREAGPSACVFCGAFFVGPSRQHTEFRVVGSDEALRKTAWNKCVVERVLVPLLVDSSVELPDRIPKLIAEHPKAYLSLFPSSSDGAGSDSSLAAHFCQRFAEQPWTLRLFDIWDNRANPVEWLVGDEDTSPTIEMVPEWLLKYRDRLTVLSSSRRRFVRWSVGDALRERVPNASHGKIRREIAADVARAVLKHDAPPESSDLKALLERLGPPTGLDAHALEGLWCFARTGSGEVMRFSMERLYVVGADRKAAAIHESLRQIGLDFEKTEWVQQEAGLPMMSSERRREIRNLIRADADGAVRLLSRVQNSRHDLIAQSRHVTGIIDFLLTVPATRLAVGDLRLGFLIRTANNKKDRRKCGVILLKPEKPTDEDAAVWQGLFRRTLAEVDPECARNLYPLVNYQPEIVQSLSDDECELKLAMRDNWLDILHSARSHCADFVESLRAELNSPNVSQNHSSQIRSGTAALIREGVGDWDRLSEPERETLLAVPIHRTSTGDYISLIGDGIGDLSTLSKRCRIQSNDDVSDAPVTLSDCYLLDSAEPSAKRLYREILQLDAHGRIAVLKDVLCQIGSAGDKSLPMLDYLGRYLHEGLERLRESTDPAERRDAGVLENLANLARSVPCIDDEWRAASVCRDGLALVQQLEDQGWIRSDIRSLLPQLFPDIGIASVDERPQRLVQRVHPGLERLDPREVANRAVTSEADGLDLLTRLKLLIDNRSDLREEARTATCVSQFRVPSIAGANVAMSQAWIRMKRKSEQKSDLSAELLKLLVPETVDLASLASQIAKRFKLQSDRQEIVRKKLRDVLAVLGVQELDEQIIRQRLVSNFALLWPKLDDDRRLKLLECVRSFDLTDDLKPVAMTLPTVRACGTGKSASKWVPPCNVISPSWMKTEPPCVSPEMRTALTGISDSVRALWDSWCALNSIESIAIHVVASAATIVTAGQSQAAIQLYRWLDQVHGSKVVERNAFVTTLRGLPWVLAMRGGATSFQRPTEIHIHAGAPILSREFWVTQAAIQLPKFCTNTDDQKELGFRNELSPSTDVVQKVAKCLEHCANADPAATIAVYRELGNLIEESEELKGCWLAVANERPVFRLFREVNDGVVPASTIFLGNAENGDDFGEVLYCLRATKQQPAIVALFKKLQVPESPQPDQLVTALSKLEGMVESHRKTYHGLIDALLRCWIDSTGVDAQSIRQIHIANCEGRFRPLAECFWDDILCDAKRIDVHDRHSLIDGTDDKTVSLVRHLLDHGHETVQKLSVLANAVLIPEPQLVEESAAMRELLEPWRRWFVEIQRPDSILHDESESLGLSIPAEGFEVLAVERILLGFRFPTGATIKASADWEGPVAFGINGNRVFVRADSLTEDLITNVHRLEAVDRAIREQVVNLLCADESHQHVHRDEAVAFIKETVERPSVVLDRLRGTTERNCFYQYNDQAADPEFATLYEQFVRSKEGTKRQQELATQLRGIVTRKFVTVRREQIRAYGYDEFSVFAELVQNAEDAYTQRQQLGLGNPPNWSVAFRYQEENEATTLTIEHFGRSFNCWRNGSLKIEAFRKDVEGVLRSSGSFKPYGQSDASDSRVIGKFGLGFKSVYLLTDCPSIYSGGWNFRIEDGCLPVVVVRPSDLCSEATRMCLPLLDPEKELRDAGVQHALCLLPFLRQTEQISITHSDSRTAVATRSVLELRRSTADESVAEMITMSLSEDGARSTVRIIRIRNASHAGQIAMFLASDDLPVAWSDGFTRASGSGQSSTCDFYSALPLKSELGCGVAVSHRFDMQSGRTHLVDSKENVERAEQIADLLPCLSDAIQVVGGQKLISERLIRFWSVWRWDRGDAETKVFRECLARQLDRLARQKKVVPTLDDAYAVSLGEQPLFTFSGIPRPVVDALVEAGVRIEEDSVALAALTMRNVLAPGFVRAFQRLRQFNMSQTSDWVEVGWEEIGTACKNLPWLATHPEILDSIAESAPEQARDEIVAWLPECQIKALDGNGRPIVALPTNVLLESDDARTLLPCQCLDFVDSSAYSDASIALLRMAGLSILPSSTTMVAIIRMHGLTADQAAGVLWFLQNEKRWRHFDNIQAEFQKPWFPAPKGRITVEDALEASLIDGGRVFVKEFKAWLGIGSTQASQRQPRIDARRLLFDLHSWWKKNGAAWERQYVRRTYPFGESPQLSKNLNLRDLPQRKEWLGLMLLGACHTIGRARPEQHKGFLEMCHQNHWMDTFAISNNSAEEWLVLLGSYLDRSPPEIKYHQWVNLFVPIFQLSNWLDAYVQQALSMDRQERFRLEHVFSPRIDCRSGGGGSDAPSCKRALGIGMCFVTRELCRLNVVSSEFAHEHCYVPSARVRSIVNLIAQKQLFPEKEGKVRQSIRIWHFLKKTFGNKGEELARFRFSGSGSTSRCGFDLPLIALCDDEELRLRLFGRNVVVEDEMVRLSLTDSNEN